MTREIRQHRRTFLQTAAAAGAGFWAAGGVTGRSKAALANGEISFACIGIDGKGKSDTADASRHGNVVAICDVDDNILRRSGLGYPKAQKFHDFRKMLDDFGKSIDAVTVSTPDHTHAPASVMAMRMGKHCFTQKPLTHSVYEARVMAQVAKESKVATQMGNQGTSENSLRKSAAIIKSGILGKISEVHVWTNRPVWAQGGDRPAEKPAPDYLKWDLWLGPAPARPYADGYHRFSWRGWWDFGTGALGDMACHTLNMPYMALNLRDPVSVEAETSGHNKDSYPKKSRIRYDFPTLGDRPAVAMYWYDGGNRPSPDILPGSKHFKGNYNGIVGRGSLVIGDKGTFFSAGDYGGDTNNSGVLADGEFRNLNAFSDDKYKYTRSPGHFKEFAEAIKGGPAAVSNFPEYAGGLTETVLLGNLAVWAGGKVEWDAKAMKPTGGSDLERIIKREYRDGYKL